MKQIVLKIDGMMCGMCEAHVNDAIRQNFTVKKVTSSHKTGETVILTEEDINAEDLENVIKQTGYELKSMEEKTYKEKKGFLGLFK